ncbi:hypothetical protein PSTG_19059, partial [Puccinia striiformis f. sp. tritici PST-78]
MAKRAGCRQAEAFQRTLTRLRSQGRQNRLIPGNNRASHPWSMFFGKLPLVDTPHALP